MEISIGVRGVLVHRYEPGNVESEPAGPFLNEKVAEKHLIQCGWIKVADKEFVDNVHKIKELQRRCKIKENLGHPESIPHITEGEEPHIACKIQEELENPETAPQFEDSQLNCSERGISIAPLPVLVCTK